MAPANSRKLSIPPINTFVKSIWLISAEKCGKGCVDVILPKITIPSETSIAITITPIVEGNLRKRTFIYENIVAIIIKIDRDVYKFIDSIQFLRYYVNETYIFKIGSFVLSQMLI